MTEWCISKQCFDMSTEGAHRAEMRFIAEQEVDDWRSYDQC